MGSRPGMRGAGVVLAGLFGVTVYGARRMVTNAIAEAGRREHLQRDLADAQLGQALGGAHDALNSVEPALRMLLGDPDLLDAVRPNLEEALSSIARLSELLRNSTPARDALVDEDGVVPLVGISAARQHREGPRAVKPLYGDRYGLARFVPAEFRGAARQVGLVMDETRLLHTAEVERAVLIFTLLSRAMLVSLSPMLGEWSPVRRPLAGGFQASDIPWAAAAVTSVATALGAPKIARMAMEKGPAGRRARTRLLLVEVPVGTAALYFSPTWTVVVFASGVTNWWQRQSRGMAFHWGKLAAFVTCVCVLQGAGLARLGVPAGSAMLEVAAALTAIMVTGASYGAMLPLTLGTAIDVLVGDGRRSVRAVLKARGELVQAAHQLNETADMIEAAAPDSDAAQVAATTARRAALQIGRAADRAGRRGLMSSHLLPELAAEAIARSFLPRRDVGRSELRKEMAVETGRHPPPYATEPILVAEGIAHRRVERQRHARALRAILERSLNEAHVHGTGGVRIILDHDGHTFHVRVGNRIVPDGAPGISGLGGSELARLGGRLPNGKVERGPRPAAEVRMPGAEEWWVVHLSCSIAIFDQAGHNEGDRRMREGTSRPTGMVNNIKVRCKKCGTTQYLKPGPGSWKCISCRSTN